MFVNVTLSEEKCHTGVCIHEKVYSPDNDRSISEGGGAVLTMKGGGLDNCGVY